MKYKKINRRKFISASFGLGAAANLNFISKANANLYNKEKILVVLELSGGNDGLNTVIPYEDDHYYKLRPNIGIKKNNLIKINDHFGFNKVLTGLESIFKDGNMAIIKNCGYKNPSYSHFTSMSYWHTAAPNSGEKLGWIGRLADLMLPNYKNAIVNIDQKQSLAVRAKNHVPIVFDKPEKFLQKGTYNTQQILKANTDIENISNLNQNFLRKVSSNTKSSSAIIKEAWNNYKQQTDHGIVPLDLNKISSLIKNRFPAKLYYTSFRNNAFDTHVLQNNLHKRLLSYTSDAINGFYNEMKLNNRDKDVVILIFSEFGRRAKENTNLGTDHGSAGPMFLIGSNVKGGFYGRNFDLSKDLDEMDNLIFDTDFRRVYAEVINKWFNFDASKVLNDKFKSLNIIRT